ncbi:MAG: pyridoxamine 5'-phosphate oxidase family protein [Saccharospirillum sp.]
MSRRTTDHESPLHTDRSHVKRGPNRADYDRKRVDAILDASLFCTVAQSIEGQPFVTPTCHWRYGDHLYWHGHARARNLAPGQPVCINVTQFDGLVLARSAFHHSVNYRSVTLFGEAEPVTDPDEKTRQLARFIEKIAPQRWPQLRPMTQPELKGTGISRIRIAEASCKVRAEGVNDDAGDVDWPVWAGVVPLLRQWGMPQQEAGQPSGLSPPAVVDVW